MTTTEDYIENMPTKSANLFVWAVTVLFVIVLAGFLLIKQPDVVTGNIRLIAHNQPFELLAPHTGKLMLLKYTNDSVRHKTSPIYPIRQITILWIAWLCFWEKENIPTSTKH